MLNLGLVETLAFGAVVLFLGYLVRRAVPPLARYNVPGPVIGGLLLALVTLVARQAGRTLVTFDTSLQQPLMIAFFTTVGFGASLGLLKRGGPHVVLFFLLATGAAVLQNLLGILLARVQGQPALFGVMCGSVTLTGGPATGLAFAPLFEKAGVAGAATVAVAAGMVGIVSGGLLGGPVGTFLVERLHRARQPTSPATREVPSLTAVVEAELGEPAGRTPPGEDRESYLLLQSVGLVLVALWAGEWASEGLTRLGLTLPPYIGAMLVAAALRNLDDFTGWLGLSQHALDEIGSVALSFFLVLALMTLELWTLADVALPMLVVLAGQVILIAALCLWPLFPWMGRDYDAAVTAGGFCGFMMGTTANAMANMHALAQRYGPAPRAFLVVPIVGAFLIDFTNALIITACLNLFG